MLIFKGALLSYQLLHAVYSFIINSLGRNSLLRFCFLFKLYFIDWIVDWTPADLHNVRVAQSPLMGILKIKYLQPGDEVGFLQARSHYLHCGTKKSSATTEFVLLSSHRFVFFVSRLVIGCLVQSIELHVNWHKRA